MPERHDGYRAFAPYPPYRCQQLWVRSRPLVAAENVPDGVAPARRDSGAWHGRAGRRSDRRHWAVNLRPLRHVGCHARLLDRVDVGSGCCVSGADIEGSERTAQRIAPICRRGRAPRPGYLWAPASSRSDLPRFQRAHRIPARCRRRQDHLPRTRAVSAPSPPESTGAHGFTLSGVAPIRRAGAAECRV